MDEYLAFNEGLTKFELVEVYFLQRSAIVEDATIFMTVLFGYIAVAYFVAGNLKKSEAIAITVLYSVFALFAISGMTIMIFAASSTAEALLGSTSTTMTFGLPVMFTACWVYSIFFLFRKWALRGSEA